MSTCTLLKIAVEKFAGKSSDSQYQDLGIPIKIACVLEYAPLRRGIFCLGLAE